MLLTTQCLAWTVIQNKVFMNDNLIKRRISLSNILSKKSN